MCACSFYEYLMMLNFNLYSEKAPNSPIKQWNIVFYCQTCIKSEENKYSNVLDYLVSISNEQPTCFQQTRHFLFNWRLDLVLGIYVNTPQVNLSFGGMIWLGKFLELLSTPETTNSNQYLVTVNSTSWFPFAVGAGRTCSSGGNSQPRYGCQGFLSTPTEGFGGQTSQNSSRRDN